MDMNFKTVLTDEQWGRISGIFERAPKTEKRGRPGYRNRDVFECVLWVIANGTPWATLPTRSPDFRTCHRHFMAWSRTGLLSEVLSELFGDSGVDMLQAIEARSRAPRRPRPERNVEQRAAPESRAW